MALSPIQQQYLDKNFDQAVSSFNSAKQLILKNLFFITTGTFILSVSFITAFSNQPLVHGWMLMCSWVCMALSIGTYMAAMFEDAESHGSVIDEIATIQRNGVLPNIYQVGGQPNTVAHRDRSNAFMRLTLQLAAIGVGLFLIFGLVNFEARRALRADPQLAQQILGTQQTN